MLNKQKKVNDTNQNKKIKEIENNKSVEKINRVKSLIFGKPQNLITFQINQLEKRGRTQINDGLKIPYTLKT